MPYTPLPLRRSVLTAAAVVSGFFGVVLEISAAFGDLELTEWVKVFTGGGACILLTLGLAVFLLTGFD